MRRTIDGGEHWTAQSSRTKETLHSTFFLSDRRTGAAGRWKTSLARMNPLRGSFCGPKTAAEAGFRASTVFESGRPGPWTALFSARLRKDQGGSSDAACFDQRLEAGTMVSDLLVEFFPRITKGTIASLEIFSDEPDDLAGRLAVFLRYETESGQQAVGGAYRGTTPFHRLFLDQPAMADPPGTTARYTAAAVTNLGPDDRPAGRQPAHTRRCLRPRAAR